jgi:hypothetical protein
MFGQENNDKKHDEILVMDLEFTQLLPSIQIDRRPADESLSDVLHLLRK